MSTSNLAINEPGEKYIQKMFTILFKTVNISISIQNTEADFYIFCTVFILTAVLVGNTQSNISTPRAQHTTRSAAKPTPIKYRGLSSGSKSVVRCTIFQKSLLLSPPLMRIKNEQCQSTTYKWQRNQQWT
jgi:hypothetical protein